MFAVGVMVFLGVCLFLYVARAILAPFLLAAFLTYLLSPLVLKIQSRGYRRWVAVAVIAVSLIAFLVFLLAIIIPRLIDETERFKANLPAYYAYISNLANTVRGKIEAALPVVKEYQAVDILIAKAQEIVAAFAQKLPQYIMTFSLFFRL